MSKSNNPFLPKKEYPADFTQLVNDAEFPQEYRNSVGDENLFEVFQHCPAQFTVNVMHALARKRSKWETPEGQAMLSKLNLSIDQVLKWSK